MTSNYDINNIIGLIIKTFTHLKKRITNVINNSIYYYNNYNLFYELMKFFFLQ